MLKCRDAHSQLYLDLSMLPDSAWTGLSTDEPQLGFKCNGDAAEILVP